MSDDIDLAAIRARNSEGWHRANHDVLALCDAVERLARERDEARAAIERVGALVEFEVNQSGEFAVWSSDLDAALDGEAKP